MALTGANIRAALAAVGALGGQMTSLDNLAAGANDALRRAPAGLTAAGAAAFLATMAQESAYFRTTTEYSAGRNRYSPYDGRTFEMLTWESNYRGFGKWCKSIGRVTDSEIFVKNPKALADYRYAWDGGVWFFGHNGLWKYANAGNFLAVSQGVNGGNGTIGTTFIPGGYSAARLPMYNAFHALGTRLLPAGGSTGGTIVVQHADTGQDLNAESSIADLKVLQRDILHLKQVDGIAGPDTVNALEVLAGYVKDGRLDPAGSNTLRKVQARINQQIDAGKMGNTKKLVVDGIWGPASAIAFHTYLSKGGRLAGLASQKISATPPKVHLPKNTKFPLGKGHAYAMNDGGNFTHSGVNAKDRPSIVRIQAKVGVHADGIYGKNTKAAVVKWQKAHKVTPADGEVGPSTWKAMSL